MKVALAQLNPMVGDVEGNLRKAVAALGEVDADKPDLLVFPELYIVGYPPRDLLEHKWLIKQAEGALKRLLAETSKHPGTAVLVGAPTQDAGLLRNSAILMHKGKVLLTQHKSLLPAYDVFDEDRYFTPAQKIKTVRFKGEVLGVSICEDAWALRRFSGRRYRFDPVGELIRDGATLIINISSSPYHMGKEKTRSRLIGCHAQKHKVPFIFVNQVGANDELIFDGASMAFNRRGQMTALLPRFEEAVQIIDTEAHPIKYAPQEDVASLHDALVLGVRDYMLKCGFNRAVLGLSGGIDSAVTACIAAEALGSDNVLGVSMPGPYSSRGSVVDALKLAERLGIHYTVVPITDVYESYLMSLDKAFAQTKPNITEENIQARIRGNILMALSNKFGHLVLSTGNKSELAVGYCTLYGDMSGGLAVISDVPKTMIYELASYINRRGEVIPKSSITKPPSAELKPNQKDRDSLPPYPLLDRILHYYVDESMCADDIIRKGLPGKTVHWVLKAVNRSEYKRRQAAPGLKVTSKAFGSGRRMPIAAKNEEQVF